MTLATALAAMSLANPYGPGPWGPPPPYQPAPRGQVAIVIQPLGTSSLSSDAAGYQTWPYAEGALSLELRGQRGGGRVRFTGEFSRHDRFLDAALKYNFNDEGMLQPFLSLGLGAANLGPETAWRAALVASVGLDLFLSRNFFLSGELKGRAFSDLPAGSASDVYGPGLTQTAALFGLGIYF